MTVEVTTDRSTALRRYLEFGRTVDRLLVHRYAVNEVFVTDLIKTGPDTSLIGAQLPLSHPYFLDAVDGSPEYGVLLLAEAARQACTYIAHERFAVPVGWKFLISSMSIALHDGVPLPVGDRPAELTVAARTAGAELRGGFLRTLDATLELSAGGAPVATMTGRGRYLSPDEYEYLRAGRRVGAVPMSTSLPDRPHGIPVAPRLVGRADPRNVLLVDARRAEGGGVAARLGVSGRHPTIFDHPLDHYPGMAVMEAASQAALLAVAMREGRGAARAARVVALQGDFMRFAELDAPVLLRARLEDDAQEPTAAQTGGEPGMIAAQVQLSDPDGALAELRILMTERPTEPGVAGVWI